jgi:hypothetical protein
MADDSSLSRVLREPKVLAAVIVLLVSALGGGGSALVVKDVQLQWVRADVEQQDRRIQQHDRRIEQLERRGEATLEFQARIAERIAERFDGFRSDLSTLREEARSLRALLEGLRWRR